jgi:hypothetical protein
VALSCIRVLRVTRLAALCAAVYVALWERGIGPRTTIEQLVGAFEGLMPPEDMARWTALLAHCSATAGVKSFQLRSVAELELDADGVAIDQMPVLMRSSVRVVELKSGSASSSSGRAVTAGCQCPSLTPKELALLRDILPYSSRIVGLYRQCQRSLYAHCVLRRRVNCSGTLTF